MYISIYLSIYIYIYFKIDMIWLYIIYVCVRLRMSMAMWNMYKGREKGGERCLSWPSGVIKHGVLEIHENHHLKTIETSSICKHVTMFYIFPFSNVFPIQSSTCKHFPSFSYTFPPIFPWFSWEIPGPALHRLGCRCWPLADWWPAWARCCSRWTRSPRQRRPLPDRLVDGIPQDGEVEIGMWRKSMVYGRLIYVWYMYDICMIYVWYMYDVCVIYVWYMYDICMMYVWYMYDICVIYLWCMYDICMIYVWYIPTYMCVCVSMVNGVYKSTYNWGAHDPVWGKVYRRPSVFPWLMGLCCNFSLKPIQWMRYVICFMVINMR